MDLIFGSSPGLLALAQGPEEDLGSVNSEEGRAGGVHGVGSEGLRAGEGEGEGEGLEGDVGSEWGLKDSDNGSDSSDSNGDNDVDTDTDNGYILSDDDDLQWDDEEEITDKKNMKIEEVIATYDTWLLSRNTKVEIEKTRQFVVFCDLDGVLVDFEAGVKMLFKNKKTAGTMF